MRFPIYSNLMHLNVLVLPGDGIGTEVTREAVRVLEHVAKKYGHTVQLREGLLGGIAIREAGTPFPEETRCLALDADATLMGAVGLPEYDSLPPSERPEAGLLGIRKAMACTRTFGRCGRGRRLSIPRRSRTTASRAPT